MEKWWQVPILLPVLLTWSQFQQLRFLDQQRMKSYRPLGPLPLCPKGIFEPVAGLNSPSESVLVGGSRWSRWSGKRQWRFMGKEIFQSCPISLPRWHGLKFSKIRKVEKTRERVLIEHLCIKTPNKKIELKKTPRHAKSETWPNHAPVLQNTK